MVEKLIYKGPVYIHKNTGPGNEKQPALELTVAPLICPSQIVYDPEFCPNPSFCGVVEISI